MYTNVQKKFRKTYSTLSPRTPGPSTPGPRTPGPSTPGPRTPGPSTPGSRTPWTPGSRMLESPRHVTLKHSIFKLSGI